MVAACLHGYQWVYTSPNSFFQVAAGTQHLHTPLVQDCFSVSTLAAIAARALSESANQGGPAVGQQYMLEPAPSSNWQIADQKFDFIYFRIEIPQASIAFVSVDITAFESIVG